jgi:hypothetical protein
MLEGASHPPTYSHSFSSVHLMAPLLTSSLLPSSLPPSLLPHLSSPPFSSFCVERPVEIETPESTHTARSAAATLLQRLVRGRAAQNGMFEGKARRTALIQELMLEHRGEGEWAESIGYLQLTNPASHRINPELTKVTQGRLASCIPGLPYLTSPPSSDGPWISFYLLTYTRTLPSPTQPPLAGQSCSMPLPPPWTSFSASAYPTCARPYQSRTPRPGRSSWPE